MSYQYGVGLTSARSYQFGVGRTSARLYQFGIGLICSVSYQFGVGLTGNGSYKFNAEFPSRLWYHITERLCERPYRLAGASYVSTTPSFEPNIRLRCLCSPQ